jgi:hypothetical protein
MTSMMIRKSKNQSKKWAKSEFIVLAECVYHNQSVTGTSGNH